MGQFHSPRHRDYVNLAVEVTTLQLDVKECNLEPFSLIFTKNVMIFIDYCLKNVYRSVLFKLSDISISVLSSVMATCYQWVL